MSEDDFTKLPLNERLDHKVLFIFDIVFAHLRLAELEGETAWIPRARVFLQNRRGGQ